MSVCTPTQPNATDDNSNREATTEEVESAAVNKSFNLYNAVNLGQTRTDAEKVLVVAPKVQSDGTSYFNVEGLLENSGINKFSKYLNMSGKASISISELVGTIVKIVLMTFFIVEAINAL